MWSAASHTAWSKNGRGLRDFLETLVALEFLERDAYGRYANARLAAVWPLTGAKQTSRSKAAASVFDDGILHTSARLYGSADAIREQANLPRPPPDAAHLHRSLAKSRNTISEAVWDAYVKNGRGLSAADAIAEGIEAR